MNNINNYVPRQQRRMARDCRTSAALVHGTQEWHVCPICVIHMSVLLWNWKWLS